MVDPVAIPFTTESSRWRLHVKHGRQTWHYLQEENESSGGSVGGELGKSSLLRPQSVVEKYWLGTLTEHDLPPSHPVDAVCTAGEAARRGYEFYQLLQTEDGHWAGEYGGPMFLLVGLVIVLHITGVPLEKCQRVEIIRYLRNRVTEEGGWGLHIEGPATVLGTACNYVVLRLLGVSPQDPVCVGARAFLHRNGGAVGIPSWGKFWLSVLNVYEWDGMHPLLPELWLLPYWVPFHPGRMWCHCRQIYLPMSYCYAHRLRVEPTELIQQLRRELYVQPYEEIDWAKARDAVAAVDAYAPHYKLLDVANFAMGTYEKVHSSWLRQWALREVVDHIRADDRNTHCISIGPISKVINMLVNWHHDGPDSPWFQQHVSRVADYLWMAEDGMRMQGTNGSQLWDTALAVYGLIDGGLAQEPQFQQSLRRAYDFLDDCQIKENTFGMEKFYRQPNKGAFPFSTRDCGWIVSDCTAEGLKALLYLQSFEFMPKQVSDRRIFDGIDVLLGMQNPDGGFASYEGRRGPFWLELLNPSEVFGEIMVDYSYTECSSAVTQVLSAFRKFYPDYRRKEIDRCMERAITFIRSQQQEDGSWFGSWGICFTYAAWFGLEGLACAGETYKNSPRVQKACEFLVQHQMEDGGWGESYKACTEKRYVQHETSQVVQTAWACLALMAAQYPHVDVVRRGIQLIMQRQKPTGEWKQEAIEGVFNKTCMISYPNYKFIFTIWALGKFARLYEQKEKLENFQ